MLALAALQGRTTIDAAALVLLRARLERPQPRVALGMALRGIASAMLDISDGLSGDLGHILEASRVGARIAIEHIPCVPALRARLASGERDLALAYLLAGGDDYELCFTAGKTMRERVEAVGRETGVPLARIGTITPRESGFIVCDEQGVPLPALPRSFDHFA
jgi:thiamine-monophosphate kinase